MATKKEAKDTYVVFNEIDGDDSFFGVGETLWEAVSSYCSNFETGMGNTPRLEKGMVYMVAQRKQFSSLK